MFVRPWQLGVQLYTVRNHVQTRDGFREAVSRIREIGYHAVELCAIGDHPVEWIAKVIQEADLVCCASHEPEDLLFHKPEWVAEKLKALGCSLAVFGWPGNRRLDHPDELNRLIDSLTQCCEELGQRGIRLAYHNHQLEFVRVAGKPVLEIILKRVPNLFVELDTFWTQYGGGTPDRWCARFSGRMLALHMKDYAIMGEGRITFAEVGSGNLEWPLILDAASKAGCQWYLVEQDECQGSPFDALKVSYDFVQALLHRNKDYTASGNGPKCRGPGHDPI